MLFVTEKLSQDQILSAVQKTASFWKKEISALEELEACPVLSEEALFKRFSPPPQQSGLHHMPAVLNSGKYIFMPVAWSGSWRALENTLAERAPHATLGILPTLSQMDSLVMSVFHKKRILGTVTSPGNPALAFEIIKQLQVDLIIATSNTAVALTAYRGPAGMASVRAVHMLVGPEDFNTRTSHGRSVFKDFHILPGVSVAWQCSALAEEKGDRFHPSPDFLWEAVGEHILATSIDVRPAPLLRMRVCQGLLEQSSCPCGAEFIFSIHGK